MSVTWILIADRTKAKLVHVLPHGEGPFPELASLAHEAGRLQPRERDSSKPGRVIHPAGYASAVEPHEDRDHVESRRFAAEIVHHLDHCRQEGRFDQLMVIAPPKFLGVLRDAWPPPLQKLVHREIDQDLMTVPVAELQRRLEELMPESAA